LDFHVILKKNVVIELQLQNPIKYSYSILGIFQSFHENLRIDFETFIFFSQSKKNDHFFPSKVQHTPNKNSLGIESRSVLSNNIDQMDFGFSHIKFLAFTIFTLEMYT